MKPDAKYLVEPYDEGQAAYLAGCEESANPYKLSGHKRDMTYEDERHQAWLAGFWDVEDDQS